VRWLTCFGRPRTSAREQVTVMSVIHSLDRTLLKLKWQTGGERVAYSEEIEEWLAVGLAMIAGFLDAYGIVAYNTYLSFMSGNTTQTGYNTGQANFGAALPSALAIVFFLGGSFSGALLAHSAVRQIRRLVFGMVAFSLALNIGFTRLGFFTDGVSIAVISFAMGAVNTALSRVDAQSASLTFVTGTLSRLGVQLALAVRHAPLPDSQGSSDTHLRRACLLAGIWAGFLAGALLSGTATPRFGVWVLLFPILVLSALAAFARSSSTPSDFGTHISTMQRGECGVFPEELEELGQGQ
jgi:uncharacterized membrane protein YoaK (UPF0700 family)